MGLFSLLRYKTNQIQGILLSSSFFASLLYAFAKMLSLLPHFRKEVQGAKNSVGLIFVNKQMWRLDEFVVFSKNSAKTSDLVLIPVDFNFDASEKGSSRNLPIIDGIPTRKLSLWKLSDIVWAHNLKAIVFSHPYVFWGTCFSILSLKATKTVYLPYTYGVLEKGPESHFGRKSISASSVILCETDKHMSALEGVSANQVLIRSGFPGNGLQHYSETPVVPKTVFKVLVSPHWSSVDSEASFDESKIDSLLAELVSFQNRYANSKISIQFIWRPHPWFDSFSRKLRESAHILHLIEILSDERLGNTRSTNSVINDFKSCDLLVHNSVSFIADWAFTGKPSLYWATGSQFLDKLNQIGKHLLSFSEVVFDGASVREALELSLQGVETPARKNQKIGEAWLNENGDANFNKILLHQLDGS